MKAAIFAASLMPFADFDPARHVHAPRAARGEWPRATLLARQPAGQDQRSLSFAGISDQSKLSPTPPYSGTWLSSSHAAAPENGRRYSSKSTPGFTRHCALTYGMPNCAQNSGVSSPWNCSSDGRTRPEHLRNLRRVGIDEQRDRLHEGRQRVADLARALGVEKARARRVEHQADRVGAGVAPPRARPPARVMPQILTRVLMAHRDALGARQAAPLRIVFDALEVQALGGEGRRGARAIARVEHLASPTAAGAGPCRRTPACRRCCAPCGAGRRSRGSRSRCARRCARPPMHAAVRTGDFAWHSAERNAEKSCSPDQHGRRFAHRRHLERPWNQPA